MRDSVLANLRIGATLAHRLSFGLRLSHEGHTVLRVGLDDESGVSRVPPCAFRVSVGEAWRLQRQGRCLTLCGLPQGEDPAIDLALPAGAAEHPGGVYEIELRQSRLLVIATTAGLGVCREAAGPYGLDLQVDPLLGVILMQASATDQAGTDAAREALVDAAAEVTVGELLEDAGAGMAQW